MVAPECTGGRGAFIFIAECGGVVGGAILINAADAVLC